MQFCCSLYTTLDEILAGQKRIERKLASIMALVSVDQTVLDSIGTELGTIADAVQTLVDNPDVPLGAADLTSITGAVSRIETSLAAPETPVEPAPSE